ncbi:hypothetical protein Y11_04101 [Yersinia enterocolitica subsp. palearctica Y11]|uniref:Uncharacterized protein n=1 Tax=Yersinia enterocolitica subsp. palearctica serotype O:3 (strain DSM 13030 / CIP 106945 / Y11) TaxID=930944 RepID=A0A0H3NRP3_YERE1|nr:hypothetical protein Y11_04101 [Yersinia enterocolitica subsp. palearctica Y11]
MIFKIKNILRFIKIFDYTVLKPLRTLTKSSIRSYFNLPSSLKINYLFTYLSAFQDW